jgi:hypothetical protein
MDQKQFLNDVIQALLHFLYNFFVYFLFIMPFALWKKATTRLANQRKNGGLNIGNIDSFWPFLSFLKVFILEFLIDGLIFMLYVLGIIFAIIGAIDGGVAGFFGVLIGTYYTPIALSLTRDLIQLLTQPLKKFISWISKPAQYMDLKVTNTSSAAKIDIKDI